MKRRLRKLKPLWVLMVSTRTASTVGAVLVRWRSGDWWAVTETPRCRRGWPVGRVIGPGALAGLMHGLGGAGGQQGQEGAEQVRGLGDGWRKLAPEGAGAGPGLQGAG